MQQLLFLLAQAWHVLFMCQKGQGRWCWTMLDDGPVGRWRCWNLSHCVSGNIFATPSNEPPEGIDYVNWRGEAQHWDSFWLLQVVAFCYPVLIISLDNKPQLDPPLRIPLHWSWSWNFEVAPGATTYSNPKAGAGLNAVDDIIHLYWKLG